jgi:hypothetical protein
MEPVPSDADVQFRIIEGALALSDFGLGVEPAVSVDMLGRDRGCAGGGEEVAQHCLCDLIPGLVHQFPTALR